MRCLRLAHATTGVSAGPCVQSAQACCVLSLPDKCRPHEHTARGWLQPQSTGHSSSHPKGRQITTDHNNGAGVGAEAGRGTTKARNGKGPHPAVLGASPRWAEARASPLYFRDTGVHCQRLNLTIYLAPTLLSPLRSPPRASTSSQTRPSRERRGFGKPHLPSLQTRPH